jgi:hypothetical protein
MIPSLMSNIGGIRPAKYGQEENFAAFIDGLVDGCISSLNGRARFKHLLQNPDIKGFLHNPKNYPCDGQSREKAAAAYVRFIAEPSTRINGDYSDEQVRIAILQAMSQIPAVNITNYDFLGVLWERRLREYLEFS